MYEAFYGLREKPFNLTPDPKFLYLSDKHKEAFAHLLYGIKNHSGFVMLTGEIGTGKTTICRNLLNQLDPDTELAFVFNPALSAVELLKKINGEFGIDSRPDTALELVESLNRYLLEAAARGKNCVLVIDEAQNLTPPVLEQIRLLSNLETEKDKLLQIILIGQPELAELLALKELRQLNQRITARYHLKPLTENETLQYIAYRLHVAGGRRKVQFDRKAVREIYRFSGGVPRVINAVCDRALLMGYTKELRTITAPIVAKAAKEIRGERVGRRGAWLTRSIRAMAPSPALLVTALILVLIFYAFTRPLERMLDQMTMQNAHPAPILPPPVRPGGLETVDASATPAPAPEPESVKAAAERSEFITTLLELDPATARAAAAAAILGAWKADANVTPPADDATLSIAAFALANNLAYEALTPTLDQLLALNLPAFVKMRLGTKDLWLALAGAEEEKLRVTTRNEEFALIPREEFLAYYAKEAVVLWRDPAPGAKPLWPNTSGEPVARLKEALRRLQRLPEANTTNQYDLETAAAVSRLQSETGLLVDGLAGKQVRMVLTSWLPEMATPALKPLDVPMPPPNIDVAAAAPAPEAPAPEQASPEAEAPVSTLEPQEPPPASAPVEEQPTGGVPAVAPAAEESVATTPQSVPEPIPDVAGSSVPAPDTAAMPIAESVPPPVTEPAPPISEIPETPPPLVPGDSEQQ